MQFLEELKAEFNRRVTFRERRPHVLQVVAPLFHEDGDMIDIYLDLPKEPEPKTIRISDHGMTLMRLSYSYDIDTPTKQRIFRRILSENEVLEDRGRLYVDTEPAEIYPAILRFAQVIAKVGSMQAFKREMVQSLFYEELGEFVEISLSAYSPIKSYLPIETRDDLEVDWKLGSKDREVFLFGVKDNSKARLAALACREFQMKQVDFKSVIVHEDFENGLSRKDQTRITAAADKQFTSLANFRENAESYFRREGLTPVVQ
ncbi:MAG: DUF1828 domain-containing protein [Acidobacteriota bacterium]|nr:DUF1828 domain-containing protein [Acidobacteriota bacterium]